MYENFMTENIGWVCPRCGKVHAPFVPSCDCNNSTDAASTASVSSLPSNKCPHSWRFTGQSTVGDSYTCEYCGATRTEFRNLPNGATASMTVAGKK